MSTQTFLLSACLLHSSTSLSLRSASPPHHHREAKQKSNDVSNILVALLPFRIDVAYNSSEFPQPSNSTLTSINEALTLLVVDTINATFSGRLNDLELELNELRFNSDSARQGHDDAHQWAVGVNGNATFRGSYYLDDPTEDELALVLLEEWGGDGSDVLAEALSAIVCNNLFDSECLQSDLNVQMKMMDESFQDVTSGDGQNEQSLLDSIVDFTWVNDDGHLMDEAETQNHDNEIPTQNHDKSFEPAAAASAITSISVNDSSGNNLSMWLAPTIIVLTLLFSAIMLLVYQRHRRRLESKSREISQQPTASLDEPPTNPTPNNPKKQSIDQLLREFTNDEISIISSDRQSNDNTSYYSGFSNFSDINLNARTISGLSLTSAAVTSSTLKNSGNNSPTPPHNDAAASSSSAVDIFRTISSNTKTYLPSNLQKQESFEGKYRSISAMAKVMLRKDILQVGEMDAGRGSSSSPRSKLGSENFVERGLVSDGASAPCVGIHDVSGEGGEGRVGILPAGEEEEVEEGRVEKV